MAAGMKIKAENIEQLREKLNEYAAENLKDEDLIPEIKIDALVSADSMNLQLVEELKQLEPFGAGNPKPVFCDEKSDSDRRPVGDEGKTPKIKIS